MDGIESGQVASVRERLKYANQINDIQISESTSIQNIHSTLNLKLKSILKGDV